MGRLHHPKAHFLDLRLADSTTSAATAAWPTPAAYIPAVLTADIPPLRLAPREEPARVQLQRRRLQASNAKQLVSTTIPGIKTSAAFFASLRTNLRLHASPPPPSPLSTPNSMRASATSLISPSPLSAPVMPDTEIIDASLAVPEDPLTGVPDLTSYIATAEEEKIAALKLVADSVAQQRQTASSALISHPLNISIATGALAVLFRTMLNYGWDAFAASMTMLGLVFALFAGVRFLTREYIFRAEEINLAWARDCDFLVTKFGDEVIGALLIEWASGESRKKGKKAWQGLIRAWTVRLRYRNQGVGGQLLEDAVAEAKKKGAESLEFADDHANSKRVLPALYNRIFDKRDLKARGVLKDLLDSTPVKGKRK